MCHHGIWQLFAARLSYLLNHSLKWYCSVPLNSECEAALMERGIPKENIRHYGIVFQGKTVLIG